MTEQNSRLNRRSFLKFTAGTGAAASLGMLGVSKAAAAGNKDFAAGKSGRVEQFPYATSLNDINYGDAPSLRPDKVVRTGCAYCNSQCRVIAWVKDGRVVNLYGDPKDEVQDGRLCPKGQSLIQMGYNKYRITKPLKRVGPRGSGQYREISWNQALDEIAKKLIEIRDKYGPETLVIDQTTRQEEEGFGIFERFGELYGTPNVDSGGPQCNDTGKYAMAMRAGKGKFSNGFGFDPLSGQHDLESTKYMLMFGANMAEQRVVVSGHILNKIQRDKGVKMVVIDPIMNPWGMHANEWLGIRPGTDMAFAYGMIHEIIKNDLVDKKFVKEWTLGFNELERFVNNKNYSAEWASKMTGIPAKTIKRIAREYATAEAASLWTNHGVAGHTNATQAFGVMGILVAITGNLGVPGGGALFMNNRGFGFSMPEIKHGEPPKHKGGLLLPGSIADAVLDEQPYAAKAIVNCANWITCRQDSNRMEKAYKSDKLELTVSMAIWPRYHNRFSDYILPDSTGLEKDHIGDRRDDRAIRWRNKVVEPLGEAKPVTHIWIDLARHMAKFDKKYPAKYWTENLPEKFRSKKTYWNTGTALASTSGGLSWQRLDKSDNPIKWPCPGPDHPATKALKKKERAADGGHPGVSVMYADHPGWKLLWANKKFPKGRRFPNEYNKFVIYTKEFDDKLKKLGHSALPEYHTSPANPYGHPCPSYTNEFVLNPWRGKLVRKVKWTTPNKAMMKRYPHSLTSARPSAPTMHGYSMWMWGLLELAPDEFAMMHPALAAKYGLKKGDKVKVESHVSSLTLPVFIWEGIEPNTVQIPAH
ncbi:MAG TPA: twin-arginine translocation signal domain-containing protein, partial [Thiolapillus brandeum]|nr:twin-arginine translocation signal domain-containing protein [Thiolapillus brandeum]